MENVERFKELKEKVQKLKNKQIAIKSNLDLYSKEYKELEEQLVKDFGVKSMKEAYEVKGKMEEHLKETMANLERLLEGVE